MLSIRGGRSLKPFAAIAASVVMAIAVPMTSAFADDHEGSHSKAPKAPTAPKVLTTFVANQSATCIADKAKLVADRLLDKTADMQERQLEKLADTAGEAAEAKVATDSSSDTALTTDRANIEKDCEPVPVTTPNPNATCTAAQQTLNSLKAGDPQEDMTERTTKELPGSDVKGKDNTANAAEDAKESLDLKNARMAVETNCGSSEHGD